MNLMTEINVKGENNKVDRYIKEGEARTFQGKKKQNVREHEIEKEHHQQQQQQQ